MNVFFRIAAREDILRQYFYFAIEKDSARTAERFLASVQSSIELMCTMPGAGAPKDLYNPRLAGLRSWPVSGIPAMRIYYFHSNEQLRIVRVLHGK